MNNSSQKFLGKLRIEPGAAGREAQMLTLSYAAVHPLYLVCSKAVKTPKASEGYLKVKRLSVVIRRILV